MLNVICNTPYAVLLLGCESDIGPMRFPRDPATCFGLEIEVKPGLPINEQMVDRVVKLFDKVALRRHVAIVQDFTAEVKIDGDRQATLYVATINARHKLSKHEWPTMPELLRGMPKDRNRLPYLRAWQYLSGAAHEDIKILELDDLRKHLKE